ncbi:hypothetical protein BV25DRAFT_1737344 [Artomyces pyxidatus]|uniref:Uncharacterized protein n=1 Tax=Artomyces pyxidatus TaxID=48021 RepID=A0ACB8SHC6_9AGAM|nr:hypothetical protein BV25DRAFT_1737344 [Artomyces pyxidatus]
MRETVFGSRVRDKQSGRDGARSRVFRRPAGFPRLIAALRLVIVFTTTPSLLSARTTQDCRSPRHRCPVITGKALPVSTLAALRLSIRCPHFATSRLSTPSPRTPRTSRASQRSPLFSLARACRGPLALASAAQARASSEGVTSPLGRSVGDHMREGPTRAVLERGYHLHRRNQCPRSTRRAAPCAPAQHTPHSRAGLRSRLRTATCTLRAFRAALSFEDRRVTCALG